MPRIPPHVRAVFFDAVGTLLYPEPSALVVYAEVAQRQGLILQPAEIRTRFLRAYRAEEEADAAASDWKTSERREHDRWWRIVTETLAGVHDPEECFTILFEHFAKPDAWRVAIDAADTLQSLSRCRAKLGIGSNYDNRLWPVLDGFPELAPLFDHVVISAAVGVRKPGAGFFQHAAQLVGCDVGEMLFVGDDYDNDYQGATAAGLSAILLDPHNRYPDVPQRITRLGELVER